MWPDLGPYSLHRSLAWSPNPSSSQSHSPTHTSGLSSLAQVSCLLGSPRKPKCLVQPYTPEHPAQSRTPFFFWINLIHLFMRPSLAHLNNWFGPGHLLCQHSPGLPLSWPSLAHLVAQSALLYPTAWPDPSHLAAWPDPEHLHVCHGSGHLLCNHLLLLRNGLMGIFCDLLFTGHMLLLFPVAYAEAGDQDFDHHSSYGSHVRDLIQLLNQLENWLSRLVSPSSARSSNQFRVHKTPSFSFPLHFL